MTPDEVNSLGECPAGGLHTWTDDVGPEHEHYPLSWRRHCDECGASARPANPVDDPEFYCHGQTCIDSGCSPLSCAEEPF